MNISTANSIKDNTKENKRWCYLLEMVWNTDSSFESGSKFCPMPTNEDSQPNCQVDTFAKKNLLELENTETATWNACRDLCNTNADCDFFKWKVKVIIFFENFTEQLISG